MNILIYQPYNQIVVYIESVAEQFVLQGHRVTFLSHSEKGETHVNLQRLGCEISIMPRSIKIPGVHVVMRILQLARFCRAKKIDIVYSHFQEANIVSVFTQFLCNSRFVITRHHSDSARVKNYRRQRLADRIISQLARLYIATSRVVYNEIVIVEKTNPVKVKMINYGYNFHNLRAVNPAEVKVIRETFPAGMLLVMAARFISAKRHHELIDAVKELVNRGYDIKLLLPGMGPLERGVSDYVKRLNLSDRIFLPGFELNVMDYFAAADLVVHFSSSEASNSAIKEAALTGTSVAVCTEVGDFDDYIIHGLNGFLLDKENPGKDFVRLVDQIFRKEYDLDSMGKRLLEDVVRKFDIGNVMHLYNEINASETNDRINSGVWRA